MDELIETIYELTIVMERILKEGAFEEFEELLNHRSALMIRVDEWKQEVTDFQYSSKALEMLSNILTVDQQITPLVEKKLTEIKAQLNQLKKQKQVSKQYTPYSKQTNGVFLDSKR
ncbi:flagellar protein FliT [Neobacillus drentensis]|uniref:flagellar protein FliT n=1 Tax=Neobacillus drentensis TaxID=220684 RepID=UPI002FFEE997